MIQKNYSLSLLRTFATIIIVVFHILLELSTGDGKTIFPFYIGVPIFLFLSAYLYSKKNVSNNASVFYKNNFVKIVVPTILFLAIYCFVLAIYSLCTKMPFGDLFIDFSGSGKPLSSIGHLWFIPGILFCYLILPFLQNLFDKKYKLPIIILISILLVFFELCFIDLCASVVTPFVLGYIFGRFENKSTSVDKTFAIVSIILFIALCVAYFFVFAITTSNTCQKILYILGKETIVGLMGASFSVGFISLTKKLSFSKWFTSLLDKFDNVSFPIYFVHHIFVFGGLGLLYITNFVAINIVIFLAVSTIASILFMLLSNLVVKRVKEIPFLKNQNKSS